MIALIDTGVALSSTTDSPYYDFTNAYDAYAQQVVNPSTHSIVQDNSIPGGRGHGSHVADAIVQGIQAAKSQPGAGSLDVEILPIRDVDNQGNLDPGAILRGVHWAVDHGASAINMSFGGFGSDINYYGMTLAAAIQYAQSKNVLVVTAAGNNSSNIDAHGTQSTFYPASDDQYQYNSLNISLNNLIVTAAVDASNHLTAASNWGMTSVDIGAPTGAGNDPVTSFASGTTSGVAGVIAALAPGESPASWIGIIDQTVTPAPQSVGVWSTTGGVINPAAAVAKAFGTVSLAAGAPSGIGGFASDSPYASSSNFYTTSDTISTAGVANPPPVGVFQNSRWSGSSFTETIPGLTANAAYDVRLDFAETFFSAAGQRSFNVAINGNQVLTGFDVAAAAGGKDKAVAVKLNLVATDAAGRLVITFTNVQGGAFVDAIEVAPSQTIAIASNTTGSNVPATFAPDMDYSASNTFYSSAAVDTSGIANPPPAAVFANSRWSGSSFSYVIPSLTRYVNYTVQLGFAETFFSGPGQRSLNVAINGSTVLWNFDIIGASGAPYKAVAETFNAQPDASGNITIQFTNVYGGASVNAIEVSPNLGTPLTTTNSLNTGVPLATQVDLSGYYNAVGITKDGNTSPGNLDGGNHDSYSWTFVGPVAYSSVTTLTGATYSGVTYNIGPAGSNDAVLSKGQTINLPAGNFSALSLIGTGLNGSQSSPFMVYYTNGQSATINPTFDDWHNGPSASGESAVSLSPYRNGPNGKDPYFNNFYLYQYTLNIVSYWTVRSMTLPNNSNIAIFALDLLP